MSEAIAGGGALVPASAPAILTTNEQYELRGHEQVIERGIGTFYEVGTALLAIRDGRLYRATHKTFDEYCQGRWGMSRVRAHQLIEASEVMGNLLTNGKQMPTNERQARELAKLSDVDQVLAWKTIVETVPGGKVTAGYVKAVADTLQEIRDTGHLTLGEEAAIPASEIIQARLTQEASELMLRQREHIELSQKKRAHVANNSGEYEWYTPSVYIEAARRTMGSIDCDPATSLIANQRVQAKKIYTLEDSGLDFANRWQGNVWLNPPYGRGLVEEFAQKAVAEFKDGVLMQACVLVNNATETIWFQELLACASAVCLVRGRIQYLTPEGEPLNSPLQGQAVLYLGMFARRFAREFAGIGKVLYGS